MRSRHLAALAAGLAVAVLGISCAHRYRPKGPQVKYEGFYSTFPTGLRLVVYETPQVDRFMLSVSYRAGAVDDPAGREGLAHLAEHLAFRARPAAAAPRIWDQLHGTGWSFNAFTSHDDTVYWEMGKPADLAQALALEAARMRDPLAGVSEDDLAVERDVVISEYRERFETDPLGAEVQFLMEAAFPDGHPYGRPVAGTPESLKRIALADLRRWVSERYAPAGAVMVVSSPLPARQVVGMVLAAFGERARGEGGNSVPPIEYRPPELPAPRGVEAPMVQKSAPVAAPYLWVAWPVPGFYSRRTPQAYAAADALSGLLQRRLRDQLYYLQVHRIDTGVIALDGAALVYARIELQAPGMAPKVLELANSAAFGTSVGDGLADTAVRFAAVDQVRERLLVDAYLDLESLDTPNIARFVRATGNPDYVGYWPKIVALQLNTDINSYSYEYLRRERTVAVLVLPDGSALPTRAGVPGGARKGDAVDELEDEGGRPAPGPAEALAAARPPQLDQVERRVLENGLEVLVARRGGLPVAEVRLLVRTDPSGTTAVPAGLPYLALGGDTAFYQWWGQAQAGTSRWIGVGPEHFAYRVRGTSGNLDVLLEGAGDWVRHQRIDYFDDRKRVASAAAERMARDPAVGASWAFLERLFPGHPYGVHPEAAVLAGLPETRADWWLGNQLRPERSTLIVVSDIAPTPEMWSWIEGQFGRWHAGSGRAPPADRPATVPSRRVALLDRPGATQALLLVGLQAPPPALRDDAALQVLGSVLSERLQRRIRVEEGLSYGVRIGLVDRRAGGALVIGAAVDAAGAAQSLAYVLESTAALGAAPVGADPLGRGRWRVARRFGLSFDTVAEAADALQSASLLGLGLDHYEKLPASIAALDAARIQAAARALGVGREVVVVVGDKEVLVPQLRTAGLEPEVLEAPR